MNDYKINCIMAEVAFTGRWKGHGRIIEYKHGYWSIYGIADTHRTGNNKTARRLIKKELAGVAS